MITTNEFPYPKAKLWYKIGEEIIENKDKTEKLINIIYNN